MQRRRQLRRLGKGEGTRCRQDLEGSFRPEPAASAVQPAPTHRRVRRAPGQAARLALTALQAALLSLAVAACSGARLHAQEGEDAAAGPPSAQDFDGSFPGGRSRLLHRLGSAVPAPVRSFWAAMGEHWQVYWDPDLATPRFAYPLEPVQLLEPALISTHEPASLVSACHALVDARSDFFGIDASRLSEAYVYDVAGCAVVVFDQVASTGIPIRGASLRMVVSPAGNLLWLKAFLVRDEAQGPAVEELLTREEARAVAELDGAMAYRAELEMVFPLAGEELQAPAWWVLVKFDGAEGVDQRSRLVDARDGTLLSDVSTARRFGGDEEAGAPGVEPPAGAGGAWMGTVLGVGPDAQNPYLTPFERNLIVPNPLAAIRVDLEDAEGARIAYAITDRDGHFVLPEHPDGATLRAWFEWGLPSPVDGSFFRTSILWRASHAPELFRILNASVPVQPAADLSIRFDAPPRSDQRAQSVIRHLVQIQTWNSKGLAEIRNGLRAALGIEPRDDGANVVQFLEPFLPLAGLHIEAYEANVQHYIPPDILESPLTASDCNIGDPACVSGFGVVYCGTGSTYLLHLPNPLLPPGVHISPENLPFVPTVLAHELGHHAFVNATNIVAFLSGTELDQEEGIADAIAGYICRTPDIGDMEVQIQLARFRQHLPQSFNLGSKEPGPGEEPPDYRLRARRRMGKAFWELGEPIINRTVDYPDNLHWAILLRWLSLNRARRADARIFDEGVTFLQELLLVDDLPRPAAIPEDSPLAAYFGDGNPYNGSPHEELIKSAFETLASLAEVPFRRGDVNDDTWLDMSDAVTLLGHLFQGRTLQRVCPSALDTNRDGRVDISDAVRLLGHLFMGGPELEPPGGGSCGLDPEGPWSPYNLGCLESSCPR